MPSTHFYYTDIIVGFVLLYYFIRGWHRGLWLSLLGPVAFLAGIALSSFYYQKTHQVLVSLVIGIASPVIIKLIGSLILDPLNKANTGYLSPTRLISALFNLAWGSGVAIIILLFLGLLPIEYVGLQKAKDDVVHSKSFYYVYQELVKIFPQVQNYVSPNHIDATTLMNHAEQIILTNPQVKEILNDPKMLQQIMSMMGSNTGVSNQDMQKIMNNPQIQEIMKDPKKLQEILGIINNTEHLNPATRTSPRNDQILQ